MKAFTRRFGQGFTLVEMLVTVAIVVILAAIATPAMTYAMQSMEARLVENALHDWLNSARADAMVYQRGVTLCLADENLQCVTRGGTRLISFVDHNNSNSFENVSDTLLQRHDLSLRFGTLSSRLALNRTYSKLDSQAGRPVGFMGSFHYCTTNGDLNHRFKVSFNMMGLATTKPHTPKDPTNC